MTDRQTGKTLAQLREVAAYLEARPAERVTFVTPNRVGVGYSKALAEAKGIAPETVARIDFVSPNRFTYYTARAKRWRVFVDHAATNTLTQAELVEFRRALEIARERIESTCADIRARVERARP